MPLFPEFTEKNHKNIEAIEVFLPASQQTVNIRLGLASGPWETVAEVHAGEGVVLSKGRGGAVFSDAYEKDGDLVIPVAFTHPIDFGVRVVALDKNGREHDDSKGGRGGVGGLGQMMMDQTTATFEKLALKDVQAFRLVGRYTQWVEFHNVALNPAAKNVVVAPATAEADDRQRILGVWKVLEGSSPLSKIFKNVPSTDGKNEHGVLMTPEEIQKKLKDEPIVITKDSLLGMQYTLNPSSTPKTIDLLHEGKTVTLGIYELNGDKLSMLLSETPQRPTKLKEGPAKESDDKLLILERVTTGPGFEPPWVNSNVKFHGDLELVQDDAAPETSLGAIGTPAGSVRLRRQDRVEIG